jgi:hypothetical protein
MRLPRFRILSSIPPGTGREPTLLILPNGWEYIRPVVPLLKQGSSDLSGERHFQCFERTGDRDTLYWINYLEQAYPCDGKFPRISILGSKIQTNWKMRKPTENGPVKLWMKTKKSAKPRETQHIKATCLRRRSNSIKDTYLLRRSPTR